MWLEQEVLLLASAELSLLYLGSIGLRELSPRYKGRAVPASEAGYYHGSYVTSMPYVAETLFCSGMAVASVPL